MSLDSYKVAPPTFSTDCYLKITDRPDLAYEGSLVSCLYIVTSCIKANLDCQLFRKDLGVVILTNNKFGLDTTEDIELALNTLNEIYVSGINKGIEEMRTYYGRITELVDAERRLAAGQTVITKELAHLIVSYTGHPLTEVAEQIKEFENGVDSSIIIAEAVDAMGGNNETSGSSVPQPRRRRHR